MVLEVLQKVQLHSELLTSGARLLPSTSPWKSLELWTSLPMKALFHISAEMNLTGFCLLTPL